MMNLNTALAIVYSLALENALNPDEIDAENAAEARRQSKALELVNSYMEGKTNGWEAPMNVLAPFQATATEYLCTVMVRRDLSDDMDYIEGIDDKTKQGEALAIQLAKELQAGWNDAGIAGLFQVAKVELGPEED